MFDRYLTAEPANQQRRSLIALSLVVHVGIGVAIVALTVGRAPSQDPTTVAVTYLARQPLASPRAEPVRAAPRPPRRRSRVAFKVKGARTMTVAHVIEAPSATSEPADADPPSPPSTDQGGAAGAVPKTVPQFIFDRERLVSPDPHLPDWFKDQHPRQTVSGTYRICVDTSGRVATVQVLSGIAGIDALLVEHVRTTWKYKPQPLPVCSPRVFRFQVN